MLDYTDVAFLVSCPSCGQPPEGCSSSLLIKRSNADIEMSHSCHGCFLMLVEACRLAGYEVEASSDKPLCTCWLGEMLDDG